MLFRSLLIACLVAFSSAFMAPVAPRTSQLKFSKVVMDGKGFGGGEATRDPEPTDIDPNDPKGKQQVRLAAGPLPRRTPHSGPHQQGVAPSLCARRLCPFSARVPAACERVAVRGDPAWAHCRWLHPCAGDLQGRVLRRVPGAPQGRRRWRDWLGQLDSWRHRARPAFGPATSLACMV